MSFTNHPSSEAVKLTIREQNLKFVDYCPSCDKWMKTTHITGNQKEYAYTEYTCESCNRKRKSDSLNIRENKDVNRQFLI